MSTPATSDVRDQVRRILESDAFRSAPQVSRLLSFLTDATLDGEPLKESVIGTSFFNRPSGYDPQTDPVVRTEVRRLRLKLSEYYQKEGAEAPVLIEIPSGAYKARFTMREVRPELSSESPVALLPPAPNGSAPGAPITPIMPALISLTPAPSALAPSNGASDADVHKRRAVPVKALAAAAVFLVAAAVWLLPRVTGHSATRTVAVFRLRDLDGASDNVWMGNALSVMLAADLSGADKLRSIPMNDIARSRLDLALPDAVSLGSSELSNIRRTLGADLVVAGSYMSVGNAGSRQYRMDVQIYDARTGQSVGTASDSGDERTLFEMVSRVGSRIGRDVGVETNDVRLKQLSSTPDVAQLDAKSTSRVELATTLSLRADFLPNGPEKERLYLQSLEVGRKEGSGTWELDPLIGLARIHAGQRDFEKAADFYRQVYEVSLKYYGKDNAGTAEAEVHWARMRTRIGEGKEAVQQIREAIPIARKGFPPDSVRLWNVLHDAIHTCNDNRAFQDAESYTLEGLALNARMHLPPTSERWGMLYWDLGRAKRGEKQYSEAISALEKADTNFLQFPDTRTDEVRADLAQVKAEQRGEITRAR